MTKNALQNRGQGLAPEAENSYNVGIKCRRNSGEQEEMLWRRAHAVIRRY